MIIIVVIIIIIIIIITIMSNVNTTNPCKTTKFASDSSDVACHEWSVTKIKRQLLSVALFLIDSVFIDSSLRLKFYQY